MKELLSSSANTGIITIKDNELFFQVLLLVILLMTFSGCSNTSIYESSIEKESPETDLTVPPNRVSEIRQYRKKLSPHEGIVLADGRIIDFGFVWAPIPFGPGTCPWTSDELTEKDIGSSTPLEISNSGSLPSGKSCSTATVAEIVACLDSVKEEWDGGWPIYTLLWPNCLTFIDHAKCTCCLQ